VQNGEAVLTKKPGGVLSYFLTIHVLGTLLGCLAVVASVCWERGPPWPQFWPRCPGL